MKPFTDNFLSDDDMRLLSQPGVLFRLRAGVTLGDLTPEHFAHLKRELGQFRRAEDGDRARPDLYSPELNPPSVANEQGLPTPFMPKDQHRPDRIADAEVMSYLRNINQRLEDEQITDGLQARMGTDADLPLAPVSLRDQIEAAATLHSTPTAAEKEA